MTMDTTTTGFEGVPGRLAAAVMARLNRDMEAAALDELAPAPDDSVLAVGFGPGVGVADLAVRLRHGHVAGIDPSATMVAAATRRNRAAVDTGRVQLVEAEAASIPWPDAAFSGVVAVNSLQLWEPLDVALSEVARVLSPAGVLVTLTHRWAIEKRANLDQWIETTGAVLVRCGLVDAAHRTAPFRSGEGVVLRARKPLDGNPMAP
jgi:ubiquinone/menaquinone biosynthesis C-methylase UbiE